MPPLSERAARAMLEKVLRLSKAEACTANLSGGTGGNLRYARNTVTTAGASENRALVVQSSFGRRSGTATVNELDDAAIERVVRRSEELARLAPEDPEFMDLLGPQRYARTPAWFESTAGITPEFRASAADSSIRPAKAKDCVAAGFLQDGANWQAMMNSKGLFGYHTQTGVNYSATVRTSDGTGSGYVTRDYNDVARLDVAAASAIALEKALASRNAKPIAPGRYTVILEPEASIELIQDMVYAMDARSADEGRSFLSAAGSGTRLGRKLLDDRVTIYSDPAHPDVPTAPWAADGRPLARTPWIERGVVKNLSYSRYWAQKQATAATPPPPNMIMEGGTASLEELIRGTSRGVLLTRTWYIRTVDPQTLLLTGLTRDGTFYIENGEITHAIKNMRFNESPVIMLGKVDALGRPERVRGCMIPPMRLRDFTFTSLSDAV